jgi:hypothetical protein
MQFSFMSDILHFNRQIQKSQAMCALRVRFSFMASCDWAASPYSGFAAVMKNI